ncbi:Mannosyl-oligosaccharide 1,2-alpha-mannosidase IB [Tyrophagus putrescentiae]|nr:Mannosyl-oligosaccharide 1,2-alpha-mannosidase IB [Tyrophagus putrescentiae]
MSIVKAPYSHFDTFKAALDYFEAGGGGGGGNRTTFTSLGAPVCVNSTELGVAFCRPSTAGVTVLPRMIPSRDCDLGAMFALAADRLLKSSQISKEEEEKKEKVVAGENKNLHFRRFQTPSDLSRVAKYWERAEQLTESCRRMVLLEKKEEKEEGEFSPTGRVLLYPLATDPPAKVPRYLFLIFSPDHLLPLEEWTFNGDGQPLPVKRKLKLMKEL